ncbi:MAG TPA: hypothetical protein VLA43_21570, partial [Longimicrobiales bacterium]|nr:hypothetical protein [Longimicrobiales bacterium]
MSHQGPALSESRTPAWKILVPAGVAEIALLAAAGWWPGHAPGWLFLTLGILAFGAYAAAALRIKDAQGGGLLVWGVAILLRLVLVPLAPEMSADVYRYLWDGHIQLNGMNPLRYAPVDPALAALRTSWFSFLPSTETLSPYPPVAQMAFLALSVVGGTVFQAKLLWLGFDLATGWVLGRIAAFTGRSRRLTQLLYLWSPLLVVEVAWNAQMAPMALFALALVVLLARAPVSAGAMGALSTLVAPVPLVALPPLTARLGRRFLVGFVAVLVVLTVPYASAGLGLFDGILDYVHSARIMAGGFTLLESVAPGRSLPLLLAFLLLAAVSIGVAVQRFRPERALLWTVGAVLLLTPAFRPHYALWILPLAALRVSVPWILFT